MQALCGTHRRRFLATRFLCLFAALPASGHAVSQPHRASAAEELRSDAPDTREYPRRIKALSLGSTLLILYTFATVLFCTYQGWTAFLSLFGPWRVRAVRLLSYMCVTYCTPESWGTHEHQPDHLGQLKVRSDRVRH